MPAASTWNALVWTYLSGPKIDRVLFRRIAKTKPQRIVELGLTDLNRTLRMIRMAQRYTEETIHYCGIDLFESRGESGLKLKDTHSRLSQTGGKIRLVPGELMPAIARSANILSDTDLLIISAEHSSDDLGAVQMFMPRMLKSDSSIARFRLTDDRQELRWLKPSVFIEPRKNAA